MQALSSGTGITTLESRGFGSWQRVTILASGIAEALGAPLMIGAIYDRDYFCDEQIGDVLKSLGTSLRLAWVLERKEIENYLLVPAALDRAIIRMLDARRKRGADKRAADVDSAGLLEEITRPLKDDVHSQLMARRHDYLHTTGQDRSQLYKGLLSAFDSRWASLNTRIALVPGKDVLRRFRQRVQDLYDVTLTDARIIESFHREDIPSDMRRLLDSLDSFRNAQH
jgi:hypothetical protein